MNLTRIFRAVHRDLGFLVIGISLVYGISGIFLNHLDGGDPAFRTESKMIQMQTNLSENELTSSWQSDKKLPTLKNVMRIDDKQLRLFLDGGIGTYNISDGTLAYQKYHKRFFVYWINRLHYNKVKGWKWIADGYAVSLIALAITGLFIVKGKKGLAGSGKWYLIIGILIPVIFGVILLLEF